MSTSINFNPQEMNISGVNGAESSPGLAQALLVIFAIANM